MLDSLIRPIIDRPLNLFANGVKHLPISGTAITLIGWGIGMGACYAAFLGLYWFALVLIIFNRLLDGLDGAVARVKGQSSDFGGYIDILCDFCIYAGFPLAFALGIGDLPSMTAAAFVVFCMVTTCVSFLAYAIICAKRGMETSAQGRKSFFYSFGLMEGTETIIFLILLCLFPHYFAVVCNVFGYLCLMTTALRVRMAYYVFK